MNFTEATDIAEIIASWAGALGALLFCSNHIYKLYNRLKAHREKVARGIENSKQLAKKMMSIRNMPEAQLDIALFTQITTSSLTANKVEKSILGLSTWLTIPIYGSFFLLAQNSIPDGEIKLPLLLTIALPAIAALIAEKIVTYHTSILIKLEEALIKDINEELFSLPKNKTNTESKTSTT